MRRAVALGLARTCSTGCRRSRLAPSATPVNVASSVSTSALPPHRRVVSVLGVVFCVAACTVVFVGDLEVGWDVDGETALAKCAEYGIAEWEVRADGLDALTVACGDGWSSGAFFHNIDEGRYRISVTALDSNGGTLAQRVIDADLRESDTGLWVSIFNFTAADFGSANCGNGICEAGENSASCSADCPVGANASIVVSWKINGTVGEDPTGQSWDSCAEVGAVNVEIIVDGSSQLAQCAANNQSITISGLTPGEHQIGVTLQDGSANDLSATISDTVTARTSPAEQPFNFFFSDFLDPARSNLTGDFSFRTFFESTTCSQTTPQVGQQVVLLRMDGTVLSEAQTCGPGGSSCVKTNGSDFGVCWEDVQTISNLPWGAYILRVEGVPVGRTTVCWSTDDGVGGAEIEILVGAGSDNPVVPIDLSRINRSGDCL